jgi:hypothetical protein
VEELQRQVAKARTVIPVATCLGVPGSGGLWTTQPAQTLVALRRHAEHATMPKTGCWAVARPRRSCGLFVIHCTNRVIVIPMLS